ncbi:unnamed protein product, partial [Prorocentrum cordatum]
MGPGLAARHIEPTIDNPSIEERLLVKAGKDDGSFTLTTGHGEPLLCARPRAGGAGFDISLCCDRGTEAIGPSFRLECNQSMDRWTLVSLRCDQCES